MNTWHPIFQRILDPGRGDCLTAVVASILGLPYESVPTWMADAFDAGEPHKSYTFFLKWLRENGFHYLTIQWDDLRDWRSLDGVLCIASMRSQKWENTSHAVLATWVSLPNGANQFTILHDPNPNNEPYGTEEPKRVSFLVPLSPRISSC